MKKKKNQTSPHEDKPLDSKDILRNSSSDFSIFLTSSSSSIRQIFPQKKGIYQTTKTNKSKDVDLQSKKNHKLNIVYNDSLLKTPETKTFLNDQFCIQNRKFLFQNPDFSLFQEDDLNRLLCHLREYSIHSAINRKYSEAKKSDALFDQIQFELIQRKVPTNKKKTEIENSFEKQKSKEMIKLDKELSQFDEETEEKRIQLLNKQINDSNEFEKKWREEKPPKYRKPSSKLLDLLASEKRLARVGQYDEAESYKIESEKLIEFERMQAQHLLNRDYKDSKAKFLKKQEEEFQNFTESRQQQRDLILAKRVAIEETIQKRECIILDKISQIPKTSNNDDSLVENQNFVGNDWLKYGTGGNIAKAMYDDHITFENPIPPLTPPNDEYDTNQNDLKIKKKVTQKNSLLRLKSVERNVRSDKKSESSNKFYSSLKSSNNRNSNNNNEKKGHLSSSSLSSKSSLSNKNSSRLSSVSKSSSRRFQYSSKNSKINIENSNSSIRNINNLNKKSSYSESKSETNSQLDNFDNKIIKNSDQSSYHSKKSRENKKKIDLKSLSSNSFENDESNIKNSVNLKENNSEENSKHSESSVISAASDEFAGSNSDF